MNPSDNGRPVISIFGSYKPRPGEPLYEQAYAIGYALARAGYVVCNGGYDGIMAASHQGAKAAGGTTIGVTCSVFDRYRGQKLKANRYVDHEMHICDLLERIETMLHISAGYVVLEGGTGTLSELGIIWEYVAKGLVAPRPIFVVGEFWRPLVDRLVAARPNSGKHLHRVETAEQVVAVLGGNHHRAGREPTLLAEDALIGLRRSNASTAKQNTLGFTSQNRATLDCITSAKSYKKDRPFPDEDAARQDLS